MNEAYPPTVPERPSSLPHPDTQDNALAGALEGADIALEAAVGCESPLSGRLRVLRRRLTQERLQLAVLGQFKRGKSTFINALLGADILPSGVVPLTALATFIAWGSAPRVVITFKGGAPTQEFFPQATDDIRNTLFRFVAEEANPENRLGVERVDLFYPADLLANAIVIIDTPGVGSTLLHNTEAAFQVLPECDAALFVVSADPPITEVEIEYLRRLKSKTARMFFILNKIDYLQQDDRRAVEEFLQKVLAEKFLIDADCRIFCVSAREGLAARKNGNERMLMTSGIPALEDHLVHALASEKRHWLDEAVRTKAADILAQASAELRLRRRALAMPVEELAAKSDAFQGALQSIEHERRITRDLLSGEHRRLREALDSRIERLRRGAVEKVTRVVDASLSGAGPALWEETTRRALSAALQVEFETAREPLASAFAADAGAALQGFQDRVNKLVHRIQQTAAEIFDVPLRSNIEHVAFELGEDPYWVTESVGASLIPDAGRLIDRLLPAALRRSRVRSRMIEEAHELVVRNGENLRWAILRGLDETFRKATSHFEERLDEAIDATRNVIEDALGRKRDQSLAIQPELDRLAGVTTLLASIQQELQPTRSEHSAESQDAICT